MEPSLAYISLPEFVRPADILQALKQDPLFSRETHAVWQCSHESERKRGFAEHKRGRYSVIAIAPRKILTLENNLLTVTGRDGARTETPCIEPEDPFVFIENEFPFIRTPIAAPSKLPFAGGLLGFVSYDTGRYFERIERASGRAGEPDIFLAEYDTFVVFDSARVRALATIPWASVGPSPGSTRRWTPPPITGDPARAALFAADIELPGPMTVEWDVPHGARVLAGDAELPPSCRVWGDCTLSVRAGDGAVLWEQRLSGEKPEATFRLDLPQGLSRLRMIVDPGANGAVQDRVVLRAPVMLVDP